MKPFPSLFARLRPFVTLGSLLILSLFLSACGGGSASSGADGGIIATGRALVTGNVASSTLPGDLDNITVTIQDRTTSTNSAGAFQLDDAPAGDQKIVFSKGGQASSLPLTLQSQSKTTLSNIHITDNSVSYEDVEEEDHSSVVETEDPEESVKAEDQEEIPDLNDDDKESLDTEDEDDSESEMQKQAASESVEDDEDNKEDGEDDEEGTDEK